jgi:hypothetical protein
MTVSAFALFPDVPLVIDEHASTGRYFVTSRLF